MKKNLITEKFICPKCSSTNCKYLESITNSTYEYCNACNYNFDKVIKQIDFDFILNEIKNYILNTQSKNVKVRIKKNDNKLSLTINENDLASIEFSHNILNEDIYFFKNTIHELLEDCYNDIDKSDIVICC